MKLKEIDFKLIKITFEFFDKSVDIQAEPYKTFKEVKEKAISRFMNIPDNIHFYYLGQDLSKSEDEKIGTIFNHKEKVTIALRLPRVKLKTIILKNDLSIDNIKSKILKPPEQKKDLSLLNASFNPINNKKLLLNLRSSKTKFLNEKSSHIFSRNKNNISSSLSMPHLNINKSFNDRYNDKNKNNRYNLKLDIHNLDDVSFCENHKYRVTDYCRICKKFICPECRLNETHKNHLTIHLNLNNLEESIKLYLMLVQTNEKSRVKIINKNILSEGDKTLDTFYLSERQFTMSQKYDKLDENYEVFMKKINKKLTKDTMKYKNIVINTFNDIALKINRQINEILNKLSEEKKKKKNKKISLEDLQYYFDEIAKKEETLKFIENGTIKYLLTWEINRKIEETLNIIENTLDEIINEENPFNLEHKFCQELNKIINEQNISSNDISFNKNNKRDKGNRRNGLIYNDD